MKLKNLKPINLNYKNLGIDILFVLIITLFGRLLDPPKTPSTPEEIGPLLTYLLFLTIFLIITYVLLAVSRNQIWGKPKTKNWLLFFSVIWLPFLLIFFLTLILRPFFFLLPQLIAINLDGIFSILIIELILILYFLTAYQFSQKGKVWYAISDAFNQLKQIKLPQILLHGFIVTAIFTGLNYLLSLRQTSPIWSILLAIILFSYFRDLTLHYAQPKHKKHTR